MGGYIARTPEGRGVEGEWTVSSHEAGYESPTELGGIAIAVHPHYHHPVEYKRRIYPEHIEAEWTRRADGLQVVMEVRTTSEFGPVALTFSVTPPKGVQSLDDYRLPIPLMAKKAAKSHGLELTNVSPLRKQRHLVNSDAQRARLEQVADWYHQAKTQKVPVAKYVSRKLNYAVSESRAYHLISEATKAGILIKKEKAT